MKLLDVIYETVLDIDEAGRPPLSRDEFIRRARKIHGNKYNYDHVVMGQNIFYNVQITCPIHGDFLQLPINHLRGFGCYDCGKDKLRLSKDEFIRKARKIHGNKYSYDHVVMGQNVKSKVQITCPIHGDFSQTPMSHLEGSGCGKCNESKGEKEIYKILENLNFKYEKERKFTDCINTIKSRYCRQLRFDFFLPKQKTLIEYDGELHFQIGYKNRLFLSQILNDRLKNEWCKKNGYKLIRIAYMDKKNLEEELMKGLNSDKQLYLSTNYPKDKGWRDKSI